MAGSHLIFSGFRLPLKFAKGNNSDNDAAKPNEKQGYVWYVLRNKNTPDIAIRSSLGPIALYSGAAILYFTCDTPKQERH